MIHDCIEDEAGVDVDDDAIDGKIEDDYHGDNVGVGSG